MTEVDKFTVMLDKIFKDKYPTKALIIDAFHKSKDGITKEEARQIFNAGAMWEQKATDQNFEDLWESMNIKNIPKDIILTHNCGGKISITNDETMICDKCKIEWDSCGNRIK
jgi:hypothetical protein